MTDYAVGLLLRYFGPGEVARLKLPAIDTRRDLEILRSHWAVSSVVRQFLRYLLTHSHETQSLLAVQRVNDAVVRGRVDVRATELARALSGNRALVVAEEPVRSYDTGANHVVAWVVELVARHIEYLFRVQGDHSPYRALVGCAMADVAAIRRIDVLREPLRRVQSARRPRSGALLSATRSRQPLYRMAVGAYQALVSLERGDLRTIREMLSHTLVAPLDVWRLYELVVVLGVGLAFAEQTGEPLQLRLLGLGKQEPVIRCGSFAVYWQQVTPFWTEPEQEPSELMVTRALAAYGVASGTGRPDIVVADSANGTVLAVVEVKYLAGDTSTARFREALGQIVRYSRRYAVGGDMQRLVWRSLIAMSASAPSVVDPTVPSPATLDFDGIRQGGLSAWVRDRLLAPTPFY